MLHLKGTVDGAEALTSEAAVAVASPNRRSGVEVSLVAETPRTLGDVSVVSETVLWDSSRLEEAEQNGACASLTVPSFHIRHEWIMI